MPQVCTITESFNLGIRKVTFAWTSDASGDVNGTTGVMASKITGRIERVVTDPGSTAPTTLYDIVLNDENGADVLAGAGANLSATVSVSANLNPPVLVDNTLTLVVSNAGDSKVGQVVLYVRNQ
jgi:hypothetical protein